MIKLNLPEPCEDGLFAGDGVGLWSEDKYSLVGLYDQLFSDGMKNKWDRRVYIDLYSGPGLLKVRNKDKYLWGSPMLALAVKSPFDKYIFCEKDSASLSALEKRVKQHFPNADVEFVEGDCDSKIEEICSFIPKASRTNRVLTFCFVDPYDLSIQFSTIKRIAEYLVDFLFLLALSMDANRNQAYYLNPENKKIDNFLGKFDWRVRWSDLPQPKKFPRFLAGLYAERMQSLGYLPFGFEKMKQIRSDIRNLPLYHLALFSRHKLAYQFWEQALKYSTAQLPLNLID